MSCAGKPRVEARVAALFLSLALCAGCTPAQRRASGRFLGVLGAVGTTVSAVELATNPAQVCESGGAGVCVPNTPKQRTAGWIALPVAIGMFLTGVSLVVYEVVAGARQQ
jgi:hypothetical protein